MVNAQDWLDEYYPENGVCKLIESKENFGKRRSEITNLNILGRNLNGSLKITGFSNLTTFSCFRNNLTELDVSSCSGLNKLHCNDNQLIKLEISNCLRLRGIDCSFNQLTDLTVFSKLNLCQWLNLEGNPFTGSLASLQGPPQLTKLYLHDTNIREGLEYLPAFLSKLYCNGLLAKKLADYVDIDSQISYQALKKRSSKVNS